MLEIRVKEAVAEEVVLEVGQIRYNDTGMVVLITYGRDRDRYDALVLENKHGTVSPFNWNSQNQREEFMARTYPHIAKGKLEITK